jgi:alkylation response protein AidB-like acyl-CoA dehydrogenase
VDSIETWENDVVEGAAAWARSFVAPRAAGWERDHRFARDAFDSAAEVGLTGLYVDKADGGLGLGPVAYARTFEEIAAVDMGVAFILTVHNNHVVSVAQRGSAVHKAKYLDDLLSGHILGAFALTEPGAGSDAATITTTAVADGETWVLNGSKSWVSSAAGADLLAVYATTSPEQGHKGIAAFLVPMDSPGVVREPPYHLLGAHSLGTGAVHFDNCVVDSDAMYIPAGQGFSAALAGIDMARVIVGAMCAGMMRTALDVAAERVKKRSAFGGRLADLQATRFTLADVATDLEASRLLTFSAARMMQDGRPATIAAAHAKKFAARAAERRIADCMQVMGAVGAMQSTPLPRHLAASRMTNYMDGATEIQNVVIARQLLD